MDGKSLNINNQKIEELKAIFPDVFSEGKIDIDRLKVALGEEVFVHGEHYELSWAGKTEARKEIQKQTTATLMPDREGSVDFDNAQNIFIEGENLEVLRALQKSYFGKIKMIYIDPPYNTGNDSFVYPDDYTERREEYNKRTGITNEDGFLNKQDLWKKNSRENGQFHSVWLSMMYPRLYLARNLMREDGVIFVSIDDNEQANLKLLMDDIFGEENYIAQFIWQKRVTRENRSVISVMHEYVLLYGKTAESQTENLINLLPMDEQAIERYKNPDNDPRGVWTSVPAIAQGGHGTKSQFYTLTTPSGRKIDPPSGSCWRYTQDKMKKEIEQNNIWFGSDGNGVPRIKKFLDQGRQGLTPNTILSGKDIGTTDSAKRRLVELFNGISVFETPKPVELIKHLLKMGTGKEDIVLDFFSGTAPSAEAVFELNNEDGGTRTFLLIQMPERTDPDSEAMKATFKTIADISKARISKAIEKLKKDRIKELDFGRNEFQNLGFKAYKIAPSNFNVWRNDVTGGEAIIKQLEVFTQSEKQGSEHENMLHELILKSGRQLTVSIEKMQAASSTVYNVDNKGLFVFFDKLIPEFTDMCLALQPKKVICLNSCFAKDEDLTNFKLQLRDASIELTVI